MEKNYLHKKSIKKKRKRLKGMLTIYDVISANRWVTMLVAALHLR
jgi:hypothetical protein